MLEEPQLDSWKLVRSVPMDRRSKEVENDAWSTALTRSPAQIGRTNPTG